MSGNDDIPEYLRGVAQPVEPDVPAQPIGKLPEDDDEDDEDEYEERPPLISPLAVLLVLAIFSVLCLGLTGSVVGGGTQVGRAETRAQTVAQDLISAVVAEEKIIDGIASQGGDRKRLQGLYQAVQSNKGFRKGLAAKVFAEDVQLQLAEVGDVRGTPIDASREKIMFALRDFDRALVAWQDASSGTFGRAAVAIGMANAPPG